MIVADTNLIAYLLLPGRHARQAQAVLRKDPEWCAPLLWRSELRNVFALLMRRKELELVDALALMEHADRLLGHGDYRVVSTSVLELAQASGCTAYDCEFVALALDLGIPLVTSDKALVKAFPETAITPKAFVEN